MTTPETRLERTVADLLAGIAPSHPPVDLIPETERALDETRRWPRWLAILKEPPMRHASRVVVGSPTARVAALAAATLLLAVLGVGALVAGAQSPSPPPPEDVAGQPAWVTGTVSGGTLAGTPEVKVEEGVTRSYPYHWRDMRLTTSDSRLSGTLHTIYNQDVYSGAAGDVSQFLVGAGAYRIENEAGSWEGPSIFLNLGSSGTATVSDNSVVVGSGAYEGLSAFLVFEFSSNPGTVVGAIFPGEMPPVATFEELLEE
jgi:hypothetical protein